MSELISTAGVPAIPDGLARRDGGRFTERQKFALLCPAIKRRDMRDDWRYHRRETFGQFALNTVILVACFERPWKWVFQIGYEFNRRAIHTCDYKQEEISEVVKQMTRLCRGVGVNQAGEHEFGRLFFLNRIAMLWRLLTEEEEKIVAGAVAYEIVHPRKRPSYGTITVPRWMFERRRSVA
jgi:hypothetical protein